MKSLQGLLKSKTFWFNLVSGIVMFLSETNGKVVSTEIATSIIVAGNIVLRFLTNKPLNEK
jgi:hypothetical protein